MSIKDNIVYGMDIPQIKPYLKRMSLGAYVCELMKQNGIEVALVSKIL